MSRKKNLRLDIALERYINTISISKKGWLQENYRRNVICRYSIAEMNMRDITPMHIARYRDVRLKEISPKTLQPISSNTVRLELALLSSLFNVAISEWGVCDLNPVQKVRKPKCSPGRERRLAPLEDKKISAYLRCNNLQLFYIYKLAIETAMRQGEILSLTWENINLHSGIVHLPETKNGTWRDVPLSSVARGLFRQQNPKPYGRVFDYKSSGLKSAWRRCIKDLNIIDLHFHDLRHEAISRLFELNTLNVMEVAAISGHKSLTMLKRYTHLKAYPLVAKLEGKKKKTKPLTSSFIPYPAIKRHENGLHTIELIDFDNLIATGKTESDAVANASYLLLRNLANTLHNGDVPPVPGIINPDSNEWILINPI
ncbi:site-specific integrase [Cronobacter sakazakii]|nr:site-specific integrase [Cronobacter sakazakii]